METIATSVVDLETKLEWKCGVEGEYTFDKAVNKFGKPDNDGFRLPTIEELKTLVNAHYSVFEKLDLNDSIFWSSSAILGNAKFAWFVYFYKGDVSLSLRHNFYYVRLVRDGQ